MNSLLMQCVWFWGIGQEIIDYQNVIERLEKSEYFKSLTTHKKEQLKLRLKHPYPIDVKNST